MSAEDMTLADHAEAWWSERGRRVPPRGTQDWDVMYEEWHSYAFSDFASADDDEGYSRYVMGKDWDTNPNNVGDIASNDNDD